MNARILAIVLFTLLAESCRSLSPGPPATIEPRITITVVNLKDTSVLLPGIHRQWTLAANWADRFCGDDWIV